jgi:hypothetical protein
VGRYEGQDQFSITGRIHGSYNQGNQTVAEVKLIGAAKKGKTGMEVKRRAENGS